MSYSCNADEKEGKEEGERKKEAIGNKTKWWASGYCSGFINYKHWLGTYDVPGTIPGSGDTAEAENYYFYGAYILMCMWVGGGVAKK